MRGDPPPRRKTRQGSPAGALRGTDGGSDVDRGCADHLIPEVSNALAARAAKQPRAEDNVGIIPVPSHDVTGPISANGGTAGKHGFGMGQQDWESGFALPVAHALRAEGFDASEDGTGRGTPLVPMAFAENSRGELRLQGGDGQIAPQLTTGGGKPGQGQPCIAFSAKDHGADATEGVSPTLRAGGHGESHANAGVMPAVAFDALAAGNTGLAIGEVSGALHGGGKQGGRAAVATPWAVRRLTPVECERLQGFPDSYTQVPYRGKPAADGPRYKALGNSMAVNAMEWIGARIAFVEGILETESGSC